MEPYFIKDLFYYNNVSVKGCIKLPRNPINFYDFTLVLKGSLVYIIDDQKYVINENDAILIKPGMFRERMAEKEPVNYISFNFHVFDDKQMPKDVYLKKAISNEIRNLLLSFPLKHLNPKYRGKEKTTNILNYILHEIHNAIDLESNNDYIIKIKKYIDDRINEHITLNNISQYVNLSKEYISYLFKKETNKTVTEYINEKKLLLARELIQTEELSLSNISEFLGYENYNYFSRIFKENFSITPNQLKKQFCKIDNKMR